MSHCLQPSAHFWPTRSLRCAVGKVWPTVGALTAVAAAAVFLLNPGLDGEILLASYSDPATMVMVGALGLLGVEWLARLAGHASGDPAEIKRRRSASLAR